MVKSIIAVIAAAAIAAVLIGLIPPPQPAAAAIEPPAAVPMLAAASVIAMPVLVAETDNSGCTQAWPYYEQSCLHNSHQNGKTRVVRVIADDKSVANRALRARR
jgi:hypothetical protein